VDLSDTLNLPVPGLLVISGPDWVVVRAGPVWEQILGRSPSDLVGRSLRPMVHVADRALAEAALDAVARDGGRRNFTARIIAVDGSAWPADWRARSSAGGADLGASILPYPEEARGEDVLRETHHRFRQLVQRSNDTFFIKDLDGRYVFINPAGSAALGRGIEEILGHDDSALFEPDAATEILAADRQVMESGRPTTYQTQRFVGGQQRVFLTTKYPFYDLDGHIAGVMGISRDMTEFQKMEARLLRADRLAAVGQLAAGTAHEINNPLTWVLGELSEVENDLRSRLAGAAELAPVLDRVVRAQEGGRRIARIVRNLKVYSRGGDDPAGPVTLEEALDKAAELAHNQVRHRARLVRDYHETRPVQAHEDRLVQVFLNLLVNAAQAIGPGDIGRQEIRLVTQPLGDFSEVRVSDTGHGIPAEIRERIFDPFMTTRPLGEGTGLGLWICHDLVVGWGGTIEIESEPGRGTTVIVRLPCAPDASQMQASASPPEPSAAMASALPSPSPATAPSSEVAMSKPAAALLPRVLIVDDEALIGRLLQHGLRDVADVTVLTSGQAARDRLELDPDWSLILCDLMMPDLTGMELHAWLAETRPQLAERMVFISGGAFGGDSAAFLETVRDRTLEKPFSVAAVRALVAARTGGGPRRGA
jgi:PAS domain S-box-containing protein